jgi:drug/metabolite transporter (DMT)-like permease
MPADPAPPRPGHIWLVATMVFIVLVWSINYTVAKIGFQHMRPLALAAFRIVVAGLAMVPVAVYCAWAQRRQRRSSVEMQQTRATKQISARDLWTFAYLGFFGVFVNQGIFTVGLSLTSVGHSAIVIATAPIFILLAAWTQRIERLTWRKVLGLGVAFAGALVLGTSRGWDLRSAGSQGDLLTFVAVISVAIFTVLAKRVARSYDALQFNAYVVILAALFALPVAIWQGREMIRAGEWGAVGWQGWAAMFYMGVLSSAVCISLYVWVLGWLQPSKLGALSYLQPVVGAPFATLVLGEPLTRDLIAGGALILTGVYTVQSDVSPES